MLFEQLASALQDNPEALQTESGAVSGAELLARAQDFASLLTQHGVERLGLLLDNGPAWAVAALAALQAGIVLVPIAGFFSPGQQQQLINDAGLDAILAPVALPGTSSSLATELGVLGRLQPERRCALPPGTTKITYTSGTTGEPKGVCLSQANLLAVSQALHRLTAELGVERHLCLLPLAVLLENLAGLYVPWLCGASVALLPMESLGVRGAADVDVNTLLRVLTRHQPHSLILVPALLPVIMAGRVRQLSDSYRFIALGGGKTASALQQQARDLALPLYEGYGLSEAASVVALNHPGAERFGSVGRILPHDEVRIGPGNEVQVRGNSFLGYLGDAPLAASDWLGTGDRGRLDADGYLHIDGRIKATIVTAMGRNVAPEWLEAELCAHAEVQQAYVFGDEASGIRALLVTASDTSDRLRQAVNRGLPDYARLDALYTTTSPFTAARQELTANGRLRREVLARRIKETPWDFLNS
jgi:long-subunit acyl-CoA synthetase (AMP-forming)